MDNAQIRKRSDRLHHLDALRGIAALSVLIHHVYGAYPNFEKWTCIMGRPAVTFFFLLSGYVLGKSLSVSGGIRWIEGICFYIRRFFRLYPAIFVTIVTSAILALYYVVPMPGSGLSLWFGKAIAKATTIHSLSDYLGSFRLYYLRLNPPLWTIQVEIMCSFLLPLIIWPTQRLIILKLVGLVLLGILKYFHPGSGWIGMTAYLFEFYLGYLAWTVSPHIAEISPKTSKYLILLAIIGTLVWMFLYDPSGVGFISILGMAVFLTLAGPCRWSALKSRLNNSSFQFLGKISYSMYLIHLPILMACWSLLIGRWKLVHGELFQATVLLIIVIPITFVFAALIERFVERPLNQFGHRISNAIKSFQGTSS